MKKLLAGMAIGMMTVLTVGSSRAADVTSNAQGCIATDGSNNGASNGNNSFTGESEGNRYNSFAEFNLSSINSAVSSATLVLSLLDFPLDNTTSYEIGIFGASAMTYSGLMSGASFGTVTGSNGTYSVVLDAAAINDINSNLGGNITLGFTNETLNAEPLTDDNIGIYTNAYNYRTFAYTSPVLELSGSTASTPEPTTMVLFGAGLVGLAGYARKRRQA